MVKDRDKSTSLFRNSKNNVLNDVYKILYESWRPRLFFDILPAEINPQLLDVVLRNSGGSPAYNLKFRIEPDIYYYEDIEPEPPTLATNLIFNFCVILLIILII